MLTSNIYFRKELFRKRFTQKLACKDIKPTHAKKWSKSIFNILKPNLIDALIQIVNQNKILNRGPKPDPIKIDRFLEAFWEILDNGSKTEYITKNHKISLKTYYRYLKLVIEHNLLRQMHANLLKETCSEPLKCLDASHIRSINGREGVDYGFVVYK